MSDTPDAELRRYYVDLVVDLRAEIKQLRARVDELLDERTHLLAELDEFEGRS